MAISDLIEQTIAQHIIAPRVISYAGTKLNEVKGRFVSANRVYNFVLDKKGISYSPAGQGDSLLFSGLFLERLDAARKPKVGNDKCNAGKSYQCGKICLGNRRKCHKGVRDVNDARRIASILASTNEKLQGDMFGKMLNKEVSIKAFDRGRALFNARGERVKNPKAKPDDTDALNRLEQLIELGKEKINTPAKRPIPATKQQQEDDFQKYKESDTPNQKLAQRVVDHIDNILTSNQQSGLPKGVKRVNGYLVVDSDVSNAFSKQPTDKWITRQNFIDEKTIAKNIKKIQSKIINGVSGEPQDNIIVKYRNGDYSVIRRFVGFSEEPPKKESKPRSPDQKRLFDEMSDLASRARKAYVNGDIDQMRELENLKKDKIKEYQALT